MTRTLDDIIRPQPLEASDNPPKSTANMFTDIQVARASVAEELKIDIFTETQELDNEKAFLQISRNFVCRSSFPFAELRMLTSTYNSIHS
jgi:hypothetical protein